jgi:NDP-4-keto-2,6-dideoxyhexose 3-C-methyltransferase
LGNQFVTNFVDASDSDAIRAPLDLVLCDSATGCGLLQLKHTLNHDVLYKKYWYKSGLSTTMVKALANVVSCATQLVPLSSGDIVIDIGANDGTLLRQYKTPGVITVGFEPSNLHELAVEGNSK